MTSSLNQLSHYYDLKISLEEKIRLMRNIRETKIAIVSELNNYDTTEDQYVFLLKKNELITRDVNNLTAIMGKKNVEAFTSELKTDEEKMNVVEFKPYNDEKKSDYSYFT